MMMLCIETPLYASFALRSGDGLGTRTKWRWRATWPEPAHLAIDLHTSCHLSSWFVVSSCTQRGFCSCSVWTSISRRKHHWHRRRGERSRSWPWASWGLWPFDVPVSITSGRIKRTITAMSLPPEEREREENLWDQLKSRAAGHSEKRHAVLLWNPRQISEPPAASSMILVERRCHIFLVIEWLVSMASSCTQRGCRLCSVIAMEDVNIPEKAPSALSSWREAAKLTISELRAPTVWRTSADHSRSSVKRIIAAMGYTAMAIQLNTVPMERRCWKSKYFFSIPLCRWPAKLPGTPDTCQLSHWSLRYRPSLPPSLSQSISCKARMHACMHRHTHTHTHTHNAPSQLRLSRFSACFCVWFYAFLILS